MSIDLTPFGFRKTPFTRELAVNERFALPHQVEVADALAEAVHQRMSAALIAPAGTGKTVTLRVLVASLPEARYQVRYVKVTGLSKRDLCREIAAVCGLTPTGIYPALVRKLQDTFAQCVDTDGLRPVLVLDEAHDLRPESLAMLRLLTNFEMDSRLVVAVVLAGQPPLRSLLRRPDQVAMAQRLSHYATLRLLSRDETRAYVEHRCAVTAPSLRLDLEQDRQALDQTLAIRQPKLLVLDPLVRLHRLDENSAADISGMLGFLRQLNRQHDVAIVLVHHMAKRARQDLGQALRGSSDLHA